MNTKIKILIVTALIGLVLSGCSKKQTVTVAEEEDYFPGVDRSTLVTPATRRWESTKSTSNNTVSEAESDTNLKVGSTLKIKIGRYSVTGILRVTSATSVRLENFTYNGLCPQDLKVYLAVSNRIKESVVDLGIENTAYTDTTTDYNFPANITLDDVDSFVFWCTKDDDPTYTEKIY